MKPNFFRSAAALHLWFQKNHGSERELLVGFHKKGSRSLTWPESVDEALCFGWIDGVRKSLGEESYTIRFAPRKPASTWSAVNIKRARALTEEGRMRPAGRAAFEARKQSRSRIYSYEQRSVELGEPYASLLAKNEKARAFFASRPPSYRKKASWWVTSAKKEETRQARLEKLMREWERGRTGEERR